MAGWGFSHDFEDTLPLLQANEEDARIGILRLVFDDTLTALFSVNVDCAHHLRLIIAMNAFEVSMESLCHLF